MSPERHLRTSFKVQRLPTLDAPRAGHLSPVVTERAIPPSSSKETKWQSRTPKRFLTPHPLLLLFKSRNFAQTDRI